MFCDVWGVCCLDSSRALVCTVLFYTQITMTLPFFFSLSWCTVYKHWVTLLKAHISVYLQIFDSSFGMFTWTKPFWVPLLFQTVDINFWSMYAVWRHISIYLNGPSSLHFFLPPNLAKSSKLAWKPEPLPERLDNVAYDLKKHVVLEWKLLWSLS